MIIPIHSTELRALGAVLLAKATPGPVMDALHCAHMETELGHCIRFAIRVLDGKDLPVDVVTVYEFIQQRTCAIRFPVGSKQATLQLLAELVQYSATPDAALAYFLSRANAGEDELAAEEQPWA